MREEAFKMEIPDRWIAGGLVAVFLSVVIIMAGHPILGALIVGLLYGGAMVAYSKFLAPWGKGRFLLYSGFPLFLAAARILDGYSEGALIYLGALVVPGMAGSAIALRGWEANKARIIAKLPPQPDCSSPPETHYVPDETPVVRIGLIDRIRWIRYIIQLIPSLLGRSFLTGIRADLAMDRLHVEAHGEGELGIEVAIERMHEPLRLALTAGPPPISPEDAERVLRESEAALRNCEPPPPCPIAWLRHEWYLRGAQMGVETMLQWLLGHTNARVET